MAPCSKRSWAIGAVAALLIMAGCGDDDGETSNVPAVGASSDSGDGLTVVAEDIEFGDDAYAAAAGTIPVTYRNEGSIVHTLVIEDIDGFKLEVSSNGDVDEGAVELGPGEYTMFCDVSGHRAAGMEASLQVE